MIVSFLCTGTDAAKRKKKEDALCDLLGEDAHKKKFLMLDYDGMRADVRLMEGDYIDQNLKNIVRWPAGSIHTSSGKIPAITMNPILHSTGTRVYYDFETTDLFDPAIAQIGGVRVNSSGEAKSFMFYVNPGDKKFSEGATKVHGLTNDNVLMKQNRLDQKTALQFLVSLARPGDIMIAHNGYSFDHRVLLDLCKKHGVTVPEGVYFGDTMRIFKSICTGPANVGECMKSFSIAPEALNPMLTGHDWDQSMQTLIIKTPAERETIRKMLKDRAMGAHDALWDSVAIYHIDKALREKPEYNYFT